MKRACMALLFSVLAIAEGGAASVKLSTGFDLPDTFPEDAALLLITDSTAAYFSSTSCVNTTIKTNYSIDGFSEIVLSMREYLEKTNRFDMSKYGAALLAGKAISDHNQISKRYCSTEEIKLIDFTFREFIRKIMAYK